MSLSKISQFLQVRRSGFYFRRKIPKQLRSLLSQNEFVFSLRTSEKNTALFRAAACLQLTDHFLADVTAANLATLTPALKAQLQAILSRAPAPPLSPHAPSEHLSRGSSGLMLVDRPQAATWPPDLGLSLLSTLIDLFMADSKGIDPKFKLYLSEHLQTVAYERLREFEDELFSNPHIVSKLERYELGIRFFSAYLEEPRSLRAVAKPGDKFSDTLLAVWNEVSGHIGDSDPNAAQLYCNREAIKCSLRILENAIRAARDPSFSLPAQGATLQRTQNIAPEIAAPSPTISVAWEEYVADVGSKWSALTRNMYRGYIQEFISEFTGDVPVSQLSRDDLVSYRNKLLLLPAQRKKDRRYRDKSIPELLAMEIPTNERYSDRSINERLTHLSSLLTWCRAVKGYTDKDLTYGVQIRNPESAERAPFTLDEIATLFASSHYQPKAIDSPFKFWIPLLGLYSGGRLSELAQLTTADFLQADGIPAIRVTDEGEEQNVKTAAGKRLIPVHKDLVDIGLLEYVQELRAAGVERLFPDLPKADKPGTPASKWFTQFRRKRGVQDVDALGKEKVFHSFRHTVITRLMHGDGKGTQQFPIPLVQQIVGHEKSLIGETATYTHEYPITQCKLAIESLNFGIEVEQLKNCWTAVRQHYSGKKAKT